MLLPAEAVELLPPPDEELERIAEAPVRDDLLHVDAHVDDGLGDLRVDAGEHALRAEQPHRLGHADELIGRLVSIASMPVMSMIATRARAPATARSSASVMSALRVESPTPTIGRQRIPSHTSMIGVDSSRIALLCCSMVASFSSSSRWYSALRVCSAMSDSIISFTPTHRAPSGCVSGKPESRRFEKSPLMTSESTTKRSAIRS
jgi:hypothetical protein